MLKRSITDFAKPCGMHRTFCLPNVTIPTVPLPEGFTPEETEYVVKGVCSRCAMK